MLRSLADINIPYAEWSKQTLDTIHHQLFLGQLDGISSHLASTFASYSTFSLHTLFGFRPFHSLLRREIDAFLKSPAILHLVKATLQTVIIRATPNQKHQLYALIHMLHNAGVDVSSIQTVLRYTPAPVAADDLEQRQRFYRNLNAITPTIISVLSVMGNSDAKNIKAFISQHLIQNIMAILPNIPGKRGQPGYFFASRNLTFTSSLAILKSDNISVNEKALLILLLLTEEKFSNILKPIEKSYPTMLHQQETPIRLLLQLYKDTHFSPDDAEKIEACLRLHANDHNASIDTLVQALEDSYKATILKERLDKIDCDRCDEILVVGDNGVGKTAFINMVFHGRSTDAKPLVCRDEALVALMGKLQKASSKARKHASLLEGTVVGAASLATFKQRHIQFNVWDVACIDDGCHAFDPSNKLTRANVAVVCYDVTNEHSFMNVTRYVDQLRTTLSGDLPIILVGCKMDLEKDRVVDNARGAELAKQLGLAGFDVCSAKTGANANDILTRLARGFFQARVQQAPAPAAPSSPSPPSPSPL